MSRIVYCVTQRDACRYLVDNGLVVEQVGTARKMRHIFLFNDVLICARQKVSSRCVSLLGLPLPIPFVAFLKLTAASGLSAPPSNSPKCLRFGRWQTLCTLNIHLLTYLLLLLLCASQILLLLLSHLILVLC